MFLGPDELKAIYPLDEFMRTAKIPPPGYFSGSLEALQYEGRQLGLPAGLDPVVMF
jgi:hypothetical protein